jgi:hypothetical protein
MNKTILASLMLATALGGCATAPPPVQLTPLEIQAMQSREYETAKDITFPSVVSVFQDLGYTINGADLNTGFVNAASAAQQQGPSMAEALFVGRLANTYTNQTRATAFIESTPSGGSRVRLNFVVGTQASSGYGQQSANDTPILDASVYQNAFEKLETAIFMRSASAAPAPVASTAEASQPVQ